MKRETETLELCVPERASSMSYSSGDETWSDETVTITTGMRVDLQI